MKAIVAWDRRLEALKASRRALAAQPILPSGSGPKVDPHAPLAFAGYHLMQKRGSKKVRNMNGKCLVARHR